MWEFLQWMIPVVIAGYAAEHLGEMVESLDAITAQLKKRNELLAQMRIDKQPRKG